MKFINLLVAAALAGFVLTVNAAYGDNLDIVKLRSLDNSLKHHSGNIITLRQDLMAQEPTNEQSVKDDEYSNSVLSVLSVISIESDNLIEKQSLSGEMGNESGKSAVRSPIIDGLGLSKEKCESHLDEINLNLDKIKNGALNFEVKNARDDIVKICDILNR